MQTTREARRARWLRFPPVSEGDGGRLSFDTLVEDGKRKHMHKHKLETRLYNHNRDASTGSNNTGSNRANGDKDAFHSDAAAGGGAGGAAGGGAVGGGSADDGGTDATSSPRSALQQAFRDPLMYQRWNRKQIEMRKNRRNSRKSNFAMAVRR